ncbi:hypothetical protein CSQ96_24450, partial [Janthinobacterium sp. BJB412]
MANETVTKSKRFYCVSLIPDVCKTPMGPSTPPIPYTIIGEFADAVGASPNVKSQSEPVILHQRSFIPTVKGDEPGTAGGVKSGTTGKRVETKTASSSYRANGSYLVQVGREVWMNDKNTVGKIYERGGQLPRSRLQQINPVPAGKVDELNIGRAAGAAAESVESVLDQAAEYILTGKIPEVVPAGGEVGKSMPEAVAPDKLGAAGGWLEKKFPSLGKFFKEKPVRGKKSDRSPPPRPPDKKDGGKSSKKKYEKADPPCNSCPKNAAPGKKMVRSRHPVHFGTGEEILREADFVLEGAEPLVWTRCYRSSAATQDWGLLGARWSTPFTTSLSVCAAGVVYH